MPNKFADEVKSIATELMLKNIQTEFGCEYFIVGRTPEDIVLGNGKKNVKFSRKNGKILERNVFNKTQKISRK